MKVQTGTPTKQGMYIIYEGDSFPGLPHKQLMMWINNRWGYPSSTENYRGNVLGWIGPLPTPTLEELVNKGELYVVYVSMENHGGLDGPTKDLNELLELDGEKGNVIAKVYEESGVIEYLYKWSPRKSKWRKIITDKVF